MVDSDASVERAWVAWANRYDVDPQYAVSIAHGSPADTTARTLRPDLDDAQIAEAAAYQLTMQYDDLHDVVPTRDAHRLIDTLDDQGAWPNVDYRDQTRAGWKTSAHH